MLVRDRYEEYVDEGQLDFIEPENEEEAIQFAVERFIHDTSECMTAKDMDELVSCIANLKEVIDLLDIMTNRQVSIRQVNLKKKYGSYTNLLYLDS